MRADKVSHSQEPDEISLSPFGGTSAVVVTLTNLLVSPGFGEESGLFFEVSRKTSSATWQGDLGNRCRAKLDAGMSQHRHLNP